ncbi:MAG: glycosyltransferase [Candidatus Woesearchaeota archaeon]
MKLKSYKFSIITPVLNEEDVIKECILNVINQKFDNIEHIIIDGGSTDKTKKNVFNLMKKYNHIKFYQKENSCHTNAINYGIKKSSGKIIGILNADDTYQKNTLHTIQKEFQKNPTIDAIFGNCQIKGNFKNVVLLNKPYNLTYEYLLSHIDINSFPINPCAYFYRKRIHRKIGFFNSSSNPSSDVDFVLRVVKQCSVKYIDKILGVYYRRNSSITVRSINANILSRNIKYIQNMNGITFYHRLSRFFENNARNIKIYTFYTKTHKQLFEDFFYKTADKYFDVYSINQKQISRTGEYYDQGWFLTMAQKIKLILDAIEVNRNDFFIYSDVDSQFFNNPTKLLRKKMKNVDILFQNNSPYGEICAGFMVIKSNKKTYSFFKEVLHKLQDPLNKSKDDQKIINDFLISDSYIYKKIRLLFKKEIIRTNKFSLTWDYLPDSFYTQGRFKEEIWNCSKKLHFPQKIYYHHANWIKSQKDKYAQLELVRKIITGKKEI